MPPPLWTDVNSEHSFGIYKHTYKLVELRFFLLDVVVLHFFFNLLCFVHLWSRKHTYIYTLCIIWARYETQSRHQYMDETRDETTDRGCVFCQTFYLNQKYFVNQSERNRLVVFLSEVLADNGPTTTTNK